MLEILETIPFRSKQATKKIIPPKCILNGDKSAIVRREIREQRGCICEKVIHTIQKDIFQMWICRSSIKTLTKLGDELSLHGNTTGMRARNEMNMSFVIAAGRAEEECSGIATMNDNTNRK